ncbi:hypothetical protein SAMN04488581_2657 [Mycolicibacterium neoaurum]|nr:hypothetical protein SAMN04488581_2657 [Mycolicibacterium neoaurum]
MSASQLSRDLRVVGVDLGCAALRVLVWGVAGVGSWLGRYRQDVVADRAQRVLDAERLAEAEADRDAWEPDELWRPDGPSALVWPEVRDAAVETGGLDICPTHTTTFPAGGCCRVCFPVGVSSAGAGGGPEAVSGQPPASGQPTAADLLDHATELVDVHWPDWDSETCEWTCSAPGCVWRGSSARGHAGHVADLILALVAADVRVGDALKGTR